MGSSSGSTGQPGVKADSIPISDAHCAPAERPRAGAADVQSDDAATGADGGAGGGKAAAGAVAEGAAAAKDDAGDAKPDLPKPDKPAVCPRCKSTDTKFCYYNNYNIKQPRHLCRSCQRYWTAGGTLRNVPVGAGRRKSKSAAKAEKAAAESAAAAAIAAAANAAAHAQAQVQHAAAAQVTPASIAQMPGTVASVPQMPMGMGAGVLPTPAAMFNAAQAIQAQQLRNSAAASGMVSMGSFQQLAQAQAQAGGDVAAATTAADGAQAGANAANGNGSGGDASGGSGGDSADGVSSHLTLVDRVGNTTGTVRNGAAAATNAASNRSTGVASAGKAAGMAAKSPDVAQKSARKGKGRARDSPDDNDSGRGSAQGSGDGKSATEDGRGSLHAYGGASLEQQYNAKIQAPRPGALAVPTGGNWASNNGVQQGAAAAAAGAYSSFWPGWTAASWPPYGGVYPMPGTGPPMPAMPPMPAQAAYSAQQMQQMMPALPGMATVGSAMPGAPLPPMPVGTTPSGAHPAGGYSGVAPWMYAGGGWPPQALGPGASGATTGTKPSRPIARTVLEKAAARKEAAPRSTSPHANPAAQLRSAALEG
eukprot:PRCOL_00003910-RA